MTKPSTLGELRTSWYSEDRLRNRSVKDEMRENLVARLRGGDELFSGVYGYDDTVIPQIVNAVLSRHNMILLGLRGQAKSRLLRALADLLDDEMPVVAGCEVNDNPYRPICRACRDLIAEMGDRTPIAFVGRDARYVEKLATPDVTIADIIGDVDPIKAARGGHQLSDELTIHYGLLPRANRGIFAINELPDLAGKIQVGLFNIMQEGDVQIKGYPVRLPLDVCLVFSANPEDYTARGKIITPLKDRIGSEVATHYPRTVDDGVRITGQEAWTARGDAVPVRIPEFVREVVEHIAFAAREDKRVDRRSGVSQRLPISVLEIVVSNAERRALGIGEAEAVPRLVDVYAAIPAITGKIELEYDGEQQGGEKIARDLIKDATRAVAIETLDVIDQKRIVAWFDAGNVFELGDLVSVDELVRAFARVPDLVDGVRESGLAAADDDAMVVAYVELLLEGLYASGRISRSETFSYARRAVDRRERLPQGWNESGGIN